MSEKNQQQDSSSSRLSTPTGEIESDGQITGSGEKNDKKHELQRMDSKIITVRNEDPLAHLPDDEAAIIRLQTDSPEAKVSYLGLYQYASRGDIALVVLAQITSIIGGAILPLMTIVFGSLTGTFRDFFLGTVSYGHFKGELGHFTLYFVYMAVAEFVMVYISTVLSIYTGEHISGRIRQQYLAAILRQNIGYFDKLGAGEVTTRITADTNLIQDGISEKTVLTSAALATFITAFIIGFIKNWKLTLILTSTIVAINVSFAIAGRFLVKYNKTALNSHAEGGTVAEEVLSSIRNAVAFGTQEKLADQYDTYLAVAEHWGYLHRRTLGMMIGTMMCIVYLNYGLAFWQGSRFLVSGEATLQQIITVQMAILIGAFALGNVAPNFQAFTTAVAASAKIFSTIQRSSPIDSNREDGVKLEKVVGEIELRHIKHIYPSRPEVTVIEEMDLVIPAGKVTALVGASGSGKSTIVGLVERFYDPVGGMVLLDGVDMKTMNLRWVREQVSLVQQEPILFNTSIYGNVAHGLIGTSHENATEEEKRKLVIQACEMSNAAQFIDSLPLGYETNVGERGFSLSGGQKQRIAIARAVVSDPKILLLDEATSALDTRSEGVVQAALDKASKGRTTISIAHRLSTIKGADNIVVMTQGKIVEQGQHDDLLLRKGAYYALVEAQKFEENVIDSKPAVEEAQNDDELLLERTQTQKSLNVVDPEDLEIGNKLNRSTTQKSIASLTLEGKSKEETERYGLWTLIKLIASFNKKEMPLMILGLFMSIICGGGQTTNAVLFSKSIVALSKPASEYGETRKEANFWSGMFLMLAGVMFSAYSIQGFAFAKCSEILVRRVRNKAFRSMLRQEIGWFDREENSTGALTSFLSTQTTHVAGISGTTLGTLIAVLTTLISAIVLGCAIGWKLALVCTATVPILLSCGFFRFWMLARFQQRSKLAYEQSASYACEATSAIRTVASLTREKDVYANYQRQILSQEKVSLVSILQSSLLYAMSQSFTFLCVALGFWYGGTLIASGEYSMFQFFVCFQAVIFGAQSAGTFFSFAPDMGKAKEAAQELKTLFDRKPEIDIDSTDGEKVVQVDGMIEFRDVHFRYPTRPGVPVLRGVDLIVKPGQYVALVGASGCGKSTTVSLIERFYNPVAGGIYVDGREISSLNLNEYRSFISLVSQEPVLYMGSIKDNILLGSGLNNVTDADVEKACREANIYDFIMSLPDGFNTLCGSKGSLLSGGQKQRIAIARALIRNPRILLLDEATSALDSESEKVVQAALDKASRGRTTISVAHRLSTIQKADVIYVFDGGKIVEAGTHKDLMAKRGRYAELVNLQSLGKNH